MVICLIAIANTNSSVSGYFVSVLNFADDVGQKFLEIESGMKTGVSGAAVQKNIHGVDAKNFFSKEKSDLISYTVISPEKNFAYPGDKSVAIMDMEFSAKVDNMMIQKMKFKVEGVDDARVETLSLFNSENFIAYADAHDGYFVFENLNIPIKEDGKLKLSLKVDLSFALMGGDRVRLDIADPKDVQFYDGAENIYLKGFFPLKGVNLTILGFK